MKKEEPEFKGFKKNHTAVWFINDRFGKLKKIRMLHSRKVQLSSGRGYWGYKFVEEDFLNEKGNMLLVEPCWRVHSEISENIREMNCYDFIYRQEAVFIGYIKDTE